MFRSSTSCIRWCTIIREKPIAIYMHNSSNGTSRLCSFNRDSPRKVKSVLPPITLSRCSIERFFLHNKDKEQAGWVEKAYNAASRRIRGTFAAPFRPTKLQRDFHKAQGRAASTPVIRRVAKRRRCGGWRGAAKWKRNFAIRAVKTHGVSYLFPLSLFRPRPGRAAIPSAYQKAKKSWQLAVYDQFNQVYVSLASREVEVSNNLLKLRYTIEGLKSGRIK